MAIEYRLTLAGDVVLEDVAVLVAPGATREVMPEGEQLLGFALEEKCGYVVSITAGRGGYVDAEDDGDALWEWEPERYVDVGFRMRADDLVDKGIPNMVAAVTRVLAGRSEDAALVQNGSWLLLTRMGGTLRKHHQQKWWDHYNVNGAVSE